MLKLFKSSWLRLLIIPYIFFLILIFSYGIYLKTIPVSYWDEFLWVGRSYFFEFYIHEDYKNEIWKTYESYDQPKLAEYVYGAWLYPKYLKEKQQNVNLYDYTQFLIKNGFYEIDETYIKTYTDYKKNSNFIKYDIDFFGFPEDYLTKYGSNSLKTINLIYHARVLNILILSGAVIFAYFLVSHFLGKFTAILFTVFYGFNTLIIDSGLKAHSEALFLLTFNAAFLLMNLYFSKGRKFVYLLLFSLFSGLCMSTKINGLMLTITFCISNTVLFFISKEKTIGHLFTFIVPVLISLIIFVYLNPFTFSNPIKNIQYMFNWRMNMAYNYQAEGNSHHHLIPNGALRVKKIFQNFYFSNQVSLFNGIKILETLSKSKMYGIYQFILFMIGSLYLFKLTIKKNIFAIVTLSSFITILVLMSYYLVLDWDRYYVHLLIFFIMFQIFGLIVLVKWFLKYTNLPIKAG